jgi:hypothetical protein
MNKFRGYLAIGAGIFLIVMMAGLYLFFGHLVASGSMELPQAVAYDFLGKLDLGFALLALSGAIGIGNGLWIVRRGKINIALTIVALVVAASAINFVREATAILPPG